ncbi:MAG: single-stranded-DNA-specific exonuclease RecJ [Dongiaceae bacterium]
MLAVEAPYKLSFLNKAWEIASCEERLIYGLTQQLGIGDIAARLLAQRGINNDNAAAFLNPTLRDHLPDPAGLTDMDKAVARLATAIQNKETIGIFGDYDVDGACSSALIVNYCNQLGVKTEVHIPDRREEGYGPNIGALEKLLAKGCKLIVTVDCGVTAHAPLASITGQGAEVIVVDHHMAEAALPKAYAVINPNRLDCDFPHKNLAACGVVFMLLVALNRALREAGMNNLPDLRQFLDLVALGTVADVVPLTGLNRLLVLRGLEVLNQRQNLGLTQLSDVARLKERADAYHLGFILGPRINAGGRVGKADLGVRLLTTGDIGMAQKISGELEALNVARQQIERTQVEEAIAQVEMEYRDDPVIIVGGRGWHLGVIGLIAARIKEKYQRPAAALAFEGDIATASARSVKGFDMGAAVLAAVQAGICLKGGGHAMAAGFTISHKRLKDLRAFMQERFAASGVPLYPTLNVDAILSGAALNFQVYAHIQQLGPFGTGNPEPRFLLQSQLVEYADILKGSHLRLNLRSADGARLKGIAFRAMQSGLGEAILGNRDKPLDIVGSLKLDTYNGGQRLQFIVDDARIAAGF